MLIDEKTLPAPSSTSWSFEPLTPTDSDRRYTTDSPPPYLPTYPSRDVGGFTPETSRSYGTVPASFNYTGQRPNIEAEYNPLVPAPPCFLRPVPTATSSHPTFSPITIPSRNRYSLDRGFDPLYDYSTLGLYDVQPEDFARFLSDCHIVGSLSSSKRALGNAVPITFRMGIPGIIISKTIQKLVLAKSVNDVVHLVDTWNTAFFLPRRMSVWVRQGCKRVSGTPQERALSNHLIMLWRQEKKQKPPGTAAKDPAPSVLGSPHEASDSDLEPENESLQRSDGDVKPANYDVPRGRGGVYRGILRNICGDDWKEKIYLVVERVA